ncbi:MAG TPA: hypothetical protein VGV38_20550, partial [Pyrinomonadaceae bacterium]|nr:hypothetical protein [Pyrinomonadaceae bacterium]
AGRETRGERARVRALGGDARALRRPDGKPEASDGRGLSASHAGDLTMAVAARGSVGCDIERVEERTPEVWRDLLGAEHFALAELVARETGETLSASATRVWAALECLKKAGAGVLAPLVFGEAGGDGWVALAAGASSVASCVLAVEGEENGLALALLAGGEVDARL